MSGHYLRIIVPQPAEAIKLRGPSEGVAGRPVSLRPPVTWLARRDTLAVIATNSKRYCDINLKLEVKFYCDIFFKNKLRQNPSIYIYVLDIL